MSFKVFQIKTQLMRGWCVALAHKRISVGFLCKDGRLLQMDRLAFTGGNESEAPFQAAAVIGLVQQEETIPRGR